MRLKDKVAIVTGGQSGLGKATALRFGQEGAHVVIADLVLEGAQEVAGEIQSMGRQALAIKTDVSKASDIKAMVAKTIDTFGRIDILVNNAGIIIRKTILQHTEEDWDKMMGVNLKAVFLSIREVVPHMIEQGGGKIINISSIAGMIGYAYSSYAASKAGVYNLTRQLVLELAPKNINVNCICPGAFRTPINEDMVKLYPGVEERIANAVPAKRLGKPEEIASAAVFLASEESNYIHGAPILVDGGSISVFKYFD